MHRKFALVGVAIAGAVSLAGAEFAGANDYAFEPVKAWESGNGRRHHSNPHRHGA